MKEKCKYCGGTGKRGYHQEKPCRSCKGKGKMDKDTEKDFGNPKGQTFEEVLRTTLKNSGIPYGQERGDAYRCVVASHEADKQAAVLAALERLKARSHDSSFDEYSPNDWLHAIDQAIAEAKRSTK